MACNNRLSHCALRFLVLIAFAVSLSWSAATSHSGNFVMVYGLTAPKVSLNGQACVEAIAKVGNTNWWIVPMTNGCAYSQWQNPSLDYGGNSSLALTWNTWPNQGDTVWIYKEYNGNYVTDGIGKPKSLYVYNPWAYSMPSMVLNGASPVGMLDVGEEHCGWYRAFFKSLPSEMNVSFVDANFGDLYGKNGLEDATAIDVKATMESFGQAWILPTPTPDGPPVVSGAWPEEDGSCTFSLAMIVRDFSKTRDDFEFDTGTPGNLAAHGCVQDATPTPTLGMVSPSLDANRKPVYSGVNKCKNAKVTEWFTTVAHAGSPTGTNATCIDLPMYKTADGMWEFTSIYHEENAGKQRDWVFLPVDDFNLYNEYSKAELINQVEKSDIDAPAGLAYWIDAAEHGGGAYNYVISRDNGAVTHNFGFCTETAADFDYRKGQKFLFAGDDDFWMFMDERLVVDIGGLHPRVARWLLLDTLAASQGWEEKSKHRMKIFHCERQSTGSNFTMRTSIYFEQKKALYFDELRLDDGLIEYDVKKLTGTQNTCAGIEMTSDSDTAVVTPSLIYVLKGGNLPVEGDTLSIGKHFGGINIINDHLFRINADQVSGLIPGIYTFYAIDASQPNLKVQVRIRVQGNLAVLNTEPVSTLAGRLVPIIVGKALWNAVTQTFDLDTGVTAYSLSTSGLEVYLDKEKKNKAATTTFETNEDGLDTLWITSPRTYLEDKSFKVNVFAGSGESKSVTFVTPTLKLEESSAWTYSFVPHGMVARLTWDSAGSVLPCVDCVDDLMIFEGGDLVLQNGEGNTVDHLMVGADGVTNFFVLSESDTGALGVEFSLKATIDSDLDHYAEAAVGPLDLLKPPVPVVRLAAMFDDDGDGIPDHLLVEFAENIADSLPTEFSYWFPDTSSLRKLTIDAMKSGLKDGNRLEFRGDFVDSILTDGTGQVNWVYEFEGRPLRLSKSISDSCGPVLRTAEVDVSDAARDIITFRFSEKMNTESSVGGSNWFEFRKGGRDLFLDYRSRTFADSGRVYSIYFLRSAGDSVKAVAGDSVRIHYEQGLEDVMLTDARKRHAHEASRLVRITGKRRVEIGSIDIVEVDVGKILDSLKKEGEKIPAGGITLVDRDKMPKEVAEEHGTHGFLIPFDLLSNYIEAAGRDPKQLALVIRMELYTNLAGYFSTYEVEIGCDDDLFDGDCTRSALVDDKRPQIFVQWYYTSRTGRTAGTGAYISTISSAAKVRGKVLSSSRETEKAVWGLRRLDKGVHQRR